MEKTIYELELHKRCTIPELEIIRVPGGWLYRFWDYEKQLYSTTATFVPYNNDFQEKSWREQKISPEEFRHARDNIKIQ